MDKSWMPLSTRLERYCDPASLVINIYLSDLHDGAEASIQYDVDRVGFVSLAE